MKKRIVLLSAFLSPFRSGAEAMVEEVSLQLQDTFDVTIVTGRYRRSLPRVDLLGRNVRVLRIGLGFPMDKYLFPFLAPFAARSLQPSIIHAVLESYAGMALIFCRWCIPSAKRVLTLQSTNTSLFLGAMHRSAHRITAISTALIQRAQTMGRSDVLHIPNGINLAEIRRACLLHPKISTRILFVGRLEHMKGVDVLLRAFAKIAASVDPTVHVRIVGNGFLFSALQKLAIKLGIDTRVTFVGRVTGQAVFDEFAQAEIFVGLSRSEALGNVFLEAAAAGCAIVATQTGGIPDIVQHNLNGILVPIDDDKAASIAIKNLLSDSSLRLRLTGEAKKNIDRYDWKNISEKYADLYRGL